MRAPSICGVLVGFATPRMVSLTTTQRDLLCQLLQAERPASAAALGVRLQLTPRQVQYGLREIRPWLSRRGVTLHYTPGVGVQLVGDAAEKQALLAELGGQTRLQLILAADQRQQLLTLRLLSASAPTILGQFQEELAVSRVTVLKDLEVVERWLLLFGVRLARRQHRGFWVEAEEWALRQALAATLWGALPCERSLFGIGPGPRIAFALAQDVALLPMVAAASLLIQALPLEAAYAAAVQAESAFGGQFVEQSLPWLALVLAVQARRGSAGRYLQANPTAQVWAEAHPAWPVARSLAAALMPGLPAAVQPAETTALAMQLCATPRDAPWVLSEPVETTLVAALLERIVRHYGLPQLAHDELLRAGLMALLPSAYVRQRFALWAPTAMAEALVERDAAERALLAELVAISERVMGVTLPPTAEGELLLLLRAAVVRLRPERERRVLIVCPSGMATTQLLVARLRARLPRLGNYEVLPMRALTAERVADADLIISTVPLPMRSELPVAVIQVHPTLKPEDIAALMQWLA